MPDNREMTYRASLLGLLIVLSVACGDSDSSSSSPTPLPTAPFSQTDIRVGTGADAVNGRTLSVNYTLWLYDPAGVDQKGRQIEAGGPFPFVLGTGNVIRGWHVGLVGMKVGGLRRLILPPDLAYGAAGSPPAIPGNATLVFDVELLAVQ